MSAWIPVKLLKDTSCSKGIQRLVISPGIAESLGGIMSGDYRVAAGASICRAHIEVKVSRGDMNVLASAGLLNALHLPSGLAISIVKEGSKGLRFGPIVGILADYRAANGPFGEQNSFLRKCIAAAARRGYLAYVITPKAALSHKCVKGYRPTGEEGWSERSFPIPDVAYDRCLTLTYSQEAALSRAKRNLKSCGVIHFNRSLGSKLKVHNYLSQFPDIRPYLPETKLVSSDAIARMVDKYKTVYVKPSMGTQGKHIARLSKIKGYGYRVLLIKSNMTKIQRFKTAKALISQLGLSKKRTFLAQQGINLITVGSRLADIRVLVQRGRNGQWNVTGAAARLGKPGSPVSNIHQGGGAIPCQKLLDMKFGSGSETAKESYKQVKSLAIAVAKALDGGIGDLGELGIDIGVDVKGRVWFIEANPRPGRTVFQMIGNPLIRSRSISRPMEYAAYLATAKHLRKEQQDVQETLD